MNKIRITQLVRRLRSVFNKSRQIDFLLLFISSIFVCPDTGNSIPHIRGDGTGIYINGDTFEFVLGKDGTNISLTEMRTGTDILEKEETSRFFHVLRNKLSYGSTEAVIKDSILTVTMSRSGVAGKFIVKAFAGYFTMELAGIENENMEEFVIADLPVTITQHRGEILNVCFNEEIAAGILSLNTKTRSRIRGDEKPALEATAYPVRGGLTGSKYAIFVVPRDSLLPTIAAIEAEQGLPSRVARGEYKAGKQENDSPYLFTQGTPENIGGIIHLAKTGGFGAIILDVDGWARSIGSYEINPERFPRGLSDLKRLIGRIQSEGLDAGLEFRIGCVGKNDPFVSPKPANGLYKNRIRTLGHEISAEDREIYITYSIQQFPPPDIFSGGEYDLQIDGEIISYSGLITGTLNPGFSGCVRGMYGTSPAPHERGVEVRHLAERRNHYIIDPESELQSDVNKRIAEIVRETGCDIALLDGSQFLATAEPVWYYQNQIFDALCSQFPAKVRIYSNVVSHFGWHYVSRLCTAERIYTDWREFLTRTLETTIKAAGDNFIMTEIGGLAVYAHSATAPHSLERDIHFAGMAGIGFGLPCSYILPENNGIRKGNLLRLLNLAGIYDKLRKEEFFAEDAKSEIRKDTGAFELTYDTRTGWDAVKIKRHEYRSSLKSREKVTWQIDNGYAGQPLSFRLTALPAAEAYSSPENLLLADFQPAGNFRTFTSTDALSTLLASSREYTRNSEFSGKLMAYDNGEKPGSWTAHVMEYKPFLNISLYPAVGCYIHGDGSGTLLTLNLHDSSHKIARTFSVSLNFEGWKYYELYSLESEIPAQPQLPGSVRRGGPPEEDFEVSAFSLVLSGAPAGQRTTTYISAVKAIRSYFSPVINPTISIGDRAVTLPVTLEVGYSLECDREGLIKILSPEEDILTAFRIRGGLPRLEKGPNTIIFSCESIGSRPAGVRCSISAAEKAGPGPGGR